MRPPADAESAHPLRLGELVLVPRVGEPAEAKSTSVSHTTLHEILRAIREHKVLILGEGKEHRQGAPR